MHRKKAKNQKLTFKGLRWAIINMFQEPKGTKIN